MILYLIDKFLILTFLTVADIQQEGVKQNQGFLLVPYSAKDYSIIIGKKYTAQIQNLVKQNKEILGDPGVRKTEKYHNFLKVQMQW